MKGDKNESLLFGEDRHTGSQIFTRWPSKSTGIQESAAGGMWGKWKG